MRLFATYQTSGAPQPRAGTLAFFSFSFSLFFIPMNPPNRGSSAVALAARSPRPRGRLFRVPNHALHALYEHRNHLQRNGRTI